MSDDSVIKIGIDLGTTNSEVAVGYTGEAEVIKSSMGDDYTPSVFGVDSTGKKEVGKRAYKKLTDSATEDNAKNYVREIKRLMGFDKKIYFPRLGTEMTPEKISAEILMSLKKDISNKYPKEKKFAAVITVPAYFEIPQKEATVRAGRLAGFDYVVTIDEPIAAAISYGLAQRSDGYWLIYDLGGGTFDVALVSLKDGVLDILEHGGDNHLGGKDFDQLVVDEVILPAILKEYKLTDLRRDNPRYARLFGKLAGLAESAKIDLSSSDSTTIEVDGIGDDDDGREILMGIPLSASEYQKLIEPLVMRTIKVASDVIRKSGVNKNSITRVVLVGAPTKMPYIRSTIERELGIEIDTSIDAMTAVARGACIYGMGQRVPDAVVLEHRSESSLDEVKLSLNYDAMTSELDAMVTGKIDGVDASGYTIQFISDNYTSASIPVTNGVFYDTVQLTKNKTNTFKISLRDKKGDAVPTFPEVFTITQSLTLSGTPLSHAVGVVYSAEDRDSKFGFKEKLDCYFERNTVLPCEDTKSYRMIRTLEKGDENFLKIKIYEGDADSADYVRILTELKIDGSVLPHNLPKGTEVEVTIKIDESGNMEIEGYIESIDLTVKGDKIRVSAYLEDVGENELRQDIAAQKYRLNKIQGKGQKREVLSQKIEEVEKGLEHSDTDTRQRIKRDVDEIKQEIDSMEKSLDFGYLVNEYNQTLTDAMKYVNLLKESDPSWAKNLERQIKASQEEYDRAIREKNKGLLVALISFLAGVRSQALTRDPRFWLAVYEDLQAKPLGEFTDPSSAKYHLDMCEKAIRENDLDGLKRNVSELHNLLPDSDRLDLLKNMSGVTK